MTIEATMELVTASRRLWDVCVVGAGPSGAMAARELARRGFEVLLLDRASFPRWKVCGCCLNGHALALLRAVGLQSAVMRSGAVPLHGMRLASARQEAEITLSGSVVLSREVFDAMLVEAAIDAGVTFLPRTTASLETKHATPSPVPSSLTLELRQGERTQLVRARVVVAADGLTGTFTSATGVGVKTTSATARIGVGVVAANAPAFYQPGIIYMACGRGGYLGLVRREDGQLNLAAALDPGWLRACGKPGQVAAQLLAEQGWPALPELAERSWRGTVSLTRQPRRRAGERLFLIGDAAGYIEPFTGEGMAWALAAGRAVAPLVAQAISCWRPALGRVWEARYRHLLEPRQRVCRAVAAVLRSPTLLRAFVRVLQFAPRLALPLTHHLGCAEKPPPQVFLSQTRGVQDVSIPKTV